MSARMTAADNEASDPIRRLTEDAMKRFDLGIEGRLASLVASGVIASLIRLEHSPGCVTRILIDDIPDSEFRLNFNAPKP